jgi:hypothetical protein
MKKNIFYFTLMCALLLQFSCSKQLELTPDKHLVIPQHLNDLQAILDYTPHMMVDPGADESSTDNYFISDNDYNGLDEETDRRIYSWAPDNQFETPVSDWGIVYNKVYIANTALEALASIPVTNSNKDEWEHIKGQALFVRARSFWQVANIWALAYDSSTASTDLGIPLKLSTDIKEQSLRATLKATYDQIILDMKQSISLLPTIPLNKVRPSKPAAYGFLSRIYLSMREYNNAEKYADSCFMLFSTLIDYNDLNPDDAYPFAPLNDETIYYAVSGPLLIYPYYYAKIDTLLYAQYDPNDLRKGIFFTDNGTGYQTFKGSYAAYDGLFSGIATDEILLNKAECEARRGQTSTAMAILNGLLAKRYKAGSFIPLSAQTSKEAIQIILKERRKELVMRFTRWMDIKRLNKEGAGIVLQRYIKGKFITLPPNDPRYALALPEDVISISGMSQNPR